MSAPTRQASPRTNARRRQPASDELRLDPPAGQARRPRLSWIALGLAVVLAGGLFGAVALARVADRTPTLALSEPIGAGDTLTAEHLRVVDVASDGSLPLVAASDRETLLGLTATAALPAGSLVNAELFSDGPQVEPGFAVLGLALRPGEYPVANLAPGEHVEVIRTPPTMEARSDEGSGAAVLTDSAEVFAIGSVSETSGELMVSLTVPDDTSPSIAAAAAEGRIRLALVPGP